MIVRGRPPVQAAYDLALAGAALRVALLVTIAWEPLR